MNPQSSTSSAASTVLLLSRTFALALVMATAACLYPTLPNHSAQRAAAACLNVEPYIKIVNRETEGPTEGKPYDEATSPLVTTHLYALERDELQLDDFHGRGGAIASMCDDLLVVSPWGGISVVDRHRRVEYLEGKVPMNLEGLQSHPSFGRGKYWHPNYFRVADILVTRRSEERWELFVTHHYFTGECIRFRLSSTTLLGGRPVSMSRSWRTIWDAEPCRPTAAQGGHQAGGKMLTDGPDDLLIAVGDHEWIANGVAVSQRPDSHFGKLVRVNVESGEAETVATGLRNPQGLALDMDGNLWATDHGPQGGDELNLLEPGRNYGWNHVSYGVGHGGRVNVQDERKLGRHGDFERPAFAWVPSIATTSVTVNDERWFPLWKDDLLVGSLSGAIHRVRRDGTHIQYVERMSVGVRRLRDVVQMPDGRLAVLSDGGGIHFLSRSYRYCDEAVRQASSVYSVDCEELAALVDASLARGRSASDAWPLAQGSAEDSAAKTRPVSGARLYATHCLACHSLDAEERHVGPHLADLIGRRIGRLDGWMFSSALWNLDGEWTPESLAQFLAAPQAFAPGTTMGSQGLSMTEAHAIADYLTMSPTFEMTLSAASLLLSERPGTGSGIYTVALGEAPAIEATVAIGASGPVAVDADGATAGDQHTLTFTTQNWNTPRTVVVRALPDDDATTASIALTHSVQGFGNVGEVAVTVADDDRGVVLVDAVPDTPRRDPGPLVLHEARGHPSNAVRYAVSLSAQPTAEVVVAATTDASLVSVAPASLTFTTRNWDTWRTLTAKAVEDADPTGESAAIAHVATGGGYNDVNGLLRVGLVDNDGSAVDYDADNDGLIEISTLAQLNAVPWDPHGAGAPSAGNEASYKAAFPGRGHGMGCPTATGVAVCSGYELVADLDFDTDGDGATWSGSPPASDPDDAYHNGGRGWAPIGDGVYSFRAVFDGNGHVVHNLFANTSDRFAGLFGVVEGASISRLGVANARVVSASNRVGLLAGRVVGGARVSAVWTTGAVDGTTRVGGLLGLAGWDVSVVASYSTAAVSATGQAAGLVGWNQRRASVTASYATGAVTGPHGATLHGIANGPGPVTSSYWNSATIPDDSDSTSPEGRTPAQLQAPTSATGIYAGWDALDIDGEASESPWDFGTSSDYPALSVGANHARSLAVQRGD